MPFIYTRADLKQRMNAGIHGKQGMLINPNETLNSAVRECFSSGFMDERNVMWPLDFRSARRKTPLVPNLFSGQFDYAAPTDLDAMKIIDIPAQARRHDGEFFLVPTTEFSTKRQKGMMAIKDFNGIRQLQIDSSVDSKQMMIAALDSLVSGLDAGSWEAFGDAESLTADNDDYVVGNGSILFDLNAAAGTTAGIKTDDLSILDMTDYMGGTSAFFVWARIASIIGLTNYKIRFGQDAFNYFEKTVTGQADGTAFVNGWNPLKFDVSSLTSSGSPTADDIRYIALFMTKDVGKISETDYKFDNLVLKRGVVHNVEYYSKFGWQSAAGVYKENSTDEGDLLVADFDEYEIITEKAIEKASREVREYDIAGEHLTLFRNKAKSYMLRNPSEAKIMTSEYHNYG